MTEIVPADLPEDVADSNGTVCVCNGSELSAIAFFKEIALLLDGCFECFLSVPHYRSSFLSAKILGILFIWLDI